VLWRKHLGLLIYLALSPDRTRARDHLLGLLWPEKPDAQARHSLNEAVRRLRAGLGSGRLRTRGDSITLDDTALDVDALRVAQLAAEHPAEAAALLRGDFLEGFGVEDASAFEEWATVERTRWRARGAAVFVSLGDAALTEGRLVDAEQWALRASALEPHGESGARLRLRSLALRGDVAGALTGYHEFADRLAADLGERPGRELEALAERIRTRSWRPRGEASRTTAVPLVGDLEIHRRAFQVVAEAMAGEGRTLVIVAPAGFGKTRLVGECLDRAALDGAFVVSATPLENDYDASWSTLRALARAGLAAAPGSAATAPDALAVLAAVVPEFGGRTRRDPADRGEVAAALARLLAAAAEERPLVLAVDDAHFADGASLEGLGAALAEVHHAPVALIVACLPDPERGPPALTRLRSEVGRRLPGDTVRLGPLQPVDVDRLVEALAPWCAEAEPRARLSRRVMFETGGSPFLAVTLLQALARASTIREDVLAWPRRGSTIDSPLPISVPDLVRMAVVARVSSLDPQDLQLLRAASVAGPGIDAEVLTRCSELSADEVQAALDRLERVGLVVYDGRRYAFAAPLIAEVVSHECLTSGQRRKLRLLTAEALSSRSEMDARVLRLELLAHSETGETVFADALRTADEALRAGAVRSARRALAAAERAGGAHPAGRPSLEDLRRRIETL
jgi:DNA-binding SARP family transcriptional activator